MPFTNRVIVIYFFVIPSILYAGLVTQFTFDFFAPDLLWTAYNSLAQSMLDGRLDIPYEAIGRESTYYEGKVYFYYGILPTAIRFLLAPFVDLSVTPISRVSVWLMTTIGVASLQYVLLMGVRLRAGVSWSSIDRIKLILLSLVLWFGGAHFVIIQKAALYHEPYAAMLMVSSVFISVVWRDIFWDFDNRKYRLTLYALLAALAIHARQTVALSLYIAVIVLVISCVIDTAKLRYDMPLQKIIGKFVLQVIKTGLPAFLILGMGGGLLLFLNYLRFDDFFAMSKGEYGFVRAGEGFSPRLCSKYITGAGRFEIVRILPNLVYYSVGGAYTHSNWINELGLGFVRKEMPAVRLLFLWSSNLFFLLFSIGLLVSKLLKKTTYKDVLISVIFISFMVSGILTLSYTTISFRYVADFFLPFGLGLLYFGKSWFERCEAPPVSFKSKKNIALIASLGLSIVVNILYGASMYPEYQKHHIPNMTVDGLPSKEILELLKNPKPKEGTLAEACASYEFKKR